MPRPGLPEDEVRALAFFSLVATIVSLIFVNRSFGASLVTALLRPNRTLILVLLAVASMLSLTLLWPFARGLFRFGTLHAGDFAMALGAGTVVIVLLEVAKIPYAMAARPGSTPGSPVRPRQISNPQVQ